MAQTFDNTIFKVRADSKSNWDTNHPTIQERELIVDLTQCDFKVGDGSSWDNTQYLIARNATVTAARNAATAAQNTANTAQNTALLQLSHHWKRQGVLIYHDRPLQT